jgi:uncharacterized protein YlxW (UPF0749 family)
VTGVRERRESEGRRGGTDRKEKEDLFLVGVVLITLLIDMLRSSGAEAVEMDEERGG